jgi:hypothetical protein
MKQTPKNKKQIGKKEGDFIVRILMPFGNFRMLGCT